MRGLWNTAAFNLDADVLGKEKRCHQEMEQNMTHYFLSFFLV